MIRPLVRLSLVVAFALASSTLLAQNEAKEVSEKGISFGNQKTMQWRVGVVIKAKKGPMKSAYATVPVPIVWPEQTVKVIDEDVSRGVRVSHRNLGGVRQMLVQSSGIKNGGTAKAIFTLEITRKEILPPEDTTVFQIPKSVPRNLRLFLNNSPYIDKRDSKIRALAKEAIEEKESAWDKVEAIYDMVRDKVEYKEGNIKSAKQALKDGYGDCEEMTSLFIAMCRSVKVPARMVWVPDHCYPEFYLQDDEENGHWIPCQAAGTRAFGSMPEMRPILQKGDNFKVREKEKQQRYVAEFVSAKPVRGSGAPSVSFIREYVQPSG